uniref:GCN5-related N-acetyltransferase family protein n=1 Tax=Rhizophora mucronata TaxID=61149 RepID=A0A2P2K2B8_RHIMU
MYRSLGLQFSANDCYNKYWTMSSMANDCAHAKSTSQYWIPVSVKNNLQLPCTMVFIFPQRIHVGNF